MTAQDLEQTKQVLAVPVNNVGGARYDPRVGRIPAGKSEVYLPPDTKVADLPKVYNVTWSPKKAGKKTVPKLAVYGRKGGKEHYGPRDRLLPVPSAATPGGE